MVLATFIKTIFYVRAKLVTIHQRARALSVEETHAKTMELVL